MQTLRKFVRFFREAPRARYSFGVYVLLSFVFGWVTSVVLFRGQYPLPDSILAYFVPGLLYYGSILLFFREFRSGRVMAFAVINLILVFLGVVASQFLAKGAVEVLWGWMVFLYGMNLLSLLIIRGHHQRFRSVLYPVFFVVLQGFFLQRAYSVNLVAVKGLWLSAITLGGLAVFFLLVLLFLDLFFNYGLNAGVKLSGVEMLSSLINDRVSDLHGLGIRINTRVQALRLQTEGGEAFTILIPWLHPGPMKSVGGGFLSTEIISRMAKGFFWHVPSSHAYDPSSLEFLEPMLRTVREDFPVLQGRATKQVAQSDGWFTVFGRRFESGVLIVIDSKNEDDYDLTVVDDMRNVLKETTIIVDSHRALPPKTDQVLSPLETRAESLRKLVYSVVDRLEEEKLYTLYGAWVKSGRTFFLRMKVGSESTIYVTLDQNGLGGENERRMREIIAEETGLRGERVIFLTTDSHATPEFEDSGRGLGDFAYLVRTLPEDGRIVAGVQEWPLMDVEVLGSAYYGLKSSISIIGNLFLGILILLLVGFLVWIT